MTAKKKTYALLAVIGIAVLAVAAIGAGSGLSAANSHAGSCEPEADDEDNAKVDQTGDVEDDDADEADEHEADEADEHEEADDESEQNCGGLDDGAELLGQAGISLEQAIAAAQGAASGKVGEIDLEHWKGKLVFNVEIGSKDVKVDAANGTVLGVHDD